MAEDIESRIKKTIEKIRPFIQRDGGDVTFHSYIDGIVFVVLKGACLGCEMIDSTLKDGIGNLIMEEVPEVKDVRLAEIPMEDDYDYHVPEEQQDKSENKKSKKDKKSK